jgi:hypothetical protein
VLTTEHNKRSVDGVTRSRRRTVFAVAATAALVAAAAAVASHVDSMYPTANYNPSCTDGSMGSTFCQTDNATLTVYRQASLTSTGKSNIAYVLNNEYNVTDLNVSYPSTPSYSGDAETDIIYQQRSDVPSNLDGIAWCNDAVTSTKCDQHYNAFRSSSPGRAISCHETGHAVGLTHGANASPSISQTDPSLACMQTPTPTGDLGAHNTNLINATY